MKGLLLLCCCVTILSYITHNDTNIIINNNRKLALSNDYCISNNCCVISNSNRCSLNSISTNDNVLIYPGGLTRCIFSYSKPYAFEVIKGNSNKLLVYFKGGGGCWDEDSTLKTAQCSINIDTLEQQGILDRSNSNNRYSDYTVVGILYCSGDNHVGNTTRSYSDHANKPVQQRGLVNFYSVITWLKEQQDNNNINILLDEFVIAGSSAGSVAAQLLAKKLLTIFTYKKASVLLDSNISLYPRGCFGVSFRDYGYCHAGDDILNPVLKPKCLAGQLLITDVVTDTAATFPTVPFAFIFSKLDSALRRGYELEGHSGNGYPDANITPEEFYRRANEIFLIYTQQLPNVVIYLVDGRQHTFLTSDVLTVANAMNAMGKGIGYNGISLYDWVQQFPLNDRDSVNSVCFGKEITAAELGLETDMIINNNNNDNDRRLISNEPASDGSYCMVEIINKKFTEKVVTFRK